MAKKKPKKKAARQRRPKGHGSYFFSESRGVFVQRVIVGRDADGGPLYVERSDPTEAGLAAKVALVGPTGPDATLREWFARWLEDCGVRKRTLAIRTGAVRDYFDPTLGHLKAAELTTGQINRAAAQWAAGADGLGANTVRMHLAVLHTALKAAQNSGLRPDNPAAGARKPPAVKKKINPFPVADAARVIAEASARPTTGIFAVIAATGCRYGEALALDVTDYEPGTGQLSISKTLDEDGETIGPPKTANGVRTITLPPAARPAVLAAIGRRATGPLFLNQLGLRTNRGSGRKAWFALLKRLGLARRTLHECRHTVATRMLAAGCPVGDVAKFLGDTPETVMRTYCHACGLDVGEMWGELLQSGVKVEPAGDYSAQVYYGA